MRRAWPGLLLAIAFFGAAACSSSSNAGAPVDVPEQPETGATPGDGGGGDPDGGVADAPAEVEGGSPSGDILGTLASGSCGIVQTELTKATPSLENNLLVFVAGETYDRASLSPGGQTLFDTANAGGSSAESEVLSYEVLRHCEGAKLLKTETQIAYQPPDDSGPNTITDLSVEIAGKKVGVSVTRAYKPATQPLTDVEVKALLVKKLEGINRSSERVLPADKWVKQILHVFSVSKAATDAIGRVWPAIDAAVRADTIVLVTQTTGGGFVYCNPDPPLGSECP
ncbi:MAG TPA: hypothetical protein VLT33_02345 [Labilithrix sp.]|nr:hypothetical protein [Labilithrix sp.]